MNRAFSTFDIKSINEAQRIIEGVASTPSTDRMGDIVESEGAQFKLPMPFLWQHGKDPFVGMTPVGHVIAATPHKGGIPVRIQMARSDQPGRLKDILDFAWEAVQQRLVRGMSIGFSPIGSPEPIKGTFGLRFSKWNWHELSVVTIPANEDCSISAIKALCSPTQGSVRTPSPTLGLSRKGPPMATPISDQVTAAQTELRTASTRLKELIELEGADGDLEAAQLTERDDLTTKVNRLSGKIESMKAFELSQLGLSSPVVSKAPDGDVRNPDRGHRLVMGDGPEQKLPPGIELARAVMCQMEAHRKGISAVEIAKQTYRDFPRIQAYLKEDVPAGSTLDSTWAGPLVYAQNLVSEFVEFLRPQTIIGRIDSFTRVPFNVRVTGQTSGGTGYWVGELRAKPLTFWGTNAQTMRFTKVANIAVISQELARFSNPSAEAYVRDELARACRERLDIDFIDPDKAAVANVSPASITNGLQQINSTATTTLVDIQNELASMMAPFAQWNIVPTHWIMPNTVAMKLSVFLTSLGNPAFPTINMNGGTLMGLPVITSQYLISGTPSNNLVILLSAPEIFLADDGGFAIDVSREASLEMNDAPTMSGGSLGSPTGATGSVVVSMFQINAMAIRCERFINWARRRGTTSPGVVWMDDVAWGGAIPS